ncbi:sugar ABC transporter substrate-binding protein [Fonticella tunisiensis]|uniref:Maltodextrin-binding protein n=1 Tax=Fonticella tunisiensis TaxID=1096341 RepID=A0A4R7K6L0_9CLOT|nr:maltose ABC transporter substrate-binding protein [Fonticella tunisiensis]TDT46038.1 maltose/maltodextrin transport system substrate-binding protein/arabinogalactan oligomer/maltooligosaccharide transport system substrate-binding protein [Fonticella tunisiensis]
MYKKLLKALALMLSLVLMIAAFSGCSSSTNTNKPDDKKEVTLKIWHSWTGAEEEALKEAIAKYTEKHPNVKFDTLYTPNDNFKDKVTSALQTGDGPDLFFGAHDWVGPMATGGLILPIDEYVADVKGDYIQSVYDIASLNGKHYGFPLSMEAVVLIYNKDMVPTPPATISEMIKMAKDNTKDGKYGLVVDLNNTFYNTYGFLTSFGGSALKSDGVTPNLDSQGFVDYMKFMSKLINEDKIIPKQLDYGTAQSLFLEKKAAFWINGPWCFGDIEKTQNINWGAVPLPKNDITGKDSAPFVGGKMAFLPKTASDKALAADFAKFLTSAEIEKLFYDKAGTIAANKNVTMDKWTAKLISEAAAKGVPMPVAPEMNQIWQPAKDALAAVIDNGKDAASEAKAANDKAIEAIKQMKGN